MPLGCAVPRPCLQKSTGVQGGGGEQPEAVPSSSSQPCVACSALSCAVVRSSLQCSRTIELQGEGAGGTGCSPLIRLIFQNWKVMVCAHRSEHFASFVLQNAQAGPKHRLFPTPGWSLSLSARRTLAVLQVLGVQHPFLHQWC